MKKKLRAWRGQAPLRHLNGALYYTNYHIFANIKVK